MEGWETRRIVGAINAAFSTAKEHGIELFQEDIKADPEVAISAFPKYLEKILSVNGGMFRGLQAGGPCELVTGPMLDTIGWVYSRLDKDLRRKALVACFGFLDRQNYFLAQDNVALINEPLLVGDIIFNRPLYWCGCREYADVLTPMKNWDDFAATFIDSEGGLRCRSIFWLIFALSRAGVPAAITDEFAVRFPAISIRGKHAILTFGRKYGHDRDKFSDWLFENGEPADDYLLSL